MYTYICIYIQGLGYMYWGYTEGIQCVGRIRKILYCCKGNGLETRDYYEGIIWGLDRGSYNHPLGRRHRSQVGRELTLNLKS